MRRTTTLGIAVLTVLGLVAGGPTHATASDVVQVVEPEDAHYILARMHGTWQVTEKIWVSTKGPVSTTGITVCRPVLDGLGLTCEYTSNAKNRPKLMGYGFTTWNPKTKQYESIWMDNMSHSGPSRGVATYDAEKNQLIEEVTGSGMDGRANRFAIVTSYPSTSRIIKQFSVIDEKGDSKMVMEITYERAKAGKKK
jgi:hypothetical protein